MVFIAVLLTYLLSALFAKWVFSHSRFCTHTQTHTLTTHTGHKTFCWVWEKVPFLFCVCLLWHGPVAEMEWQWKLNNQKIFTSKGSYRTKTQEKVQSEKHNFHEALQITELHIFFAAGAVNICWYCGKNVAKSTAANIQKSSVPKLIINN